MPVQEQVCFWRSTYVGGRKIEIEREREREGEGERERERYVLVLALNVLSSCDEISVGKGERS
jgi:hypothetical protein